MKYAAGVMARPNVQAKPVKYRCTQQHLLNLHSYVTLIASSNPLSSSVSGIFPFPPLLPSAVSTPTPFSSHPLPSSASQQPTFLCSQVQMSSFPTGPQRWEAVEQVAAPLYPPPPQNRAQQKQQRANTHVCGATDDWNDETYVLTRAVHVHTYMYVCMLYACTYVCCMHDSCTYVHMYVHMYVGTSEVLCAKYMYIHTYCICIRTHMHTYIYVRIHVQLNVCTQYKYTQMYHHSIFPFLWNNSTMERPFLLYRSHPRLDEMDGQCKNDLSLNKTIPKRLVPEYNDQEQFSTE